MAKLNLKIDDDRLEQLEAAALARNKSINALVIDTLEEIIAYNPIENHILLENKDVAALSAAVGGRILKNASDIVRLVQENFTLSVDGCSVKIEPEDAQCLKDMYTSYPHLTFEKYVELTAQEALSMYLTGSTRGVLV